jgi:hypothetical protein
LKQVMCFGFLSNFVSHQMLFFFWSNDIHSLAYFTVSLFFVSVVFFVLESLSKMFPPDHLLATYSHHPYTAPPVRGSSFQEEENDIIPTNQASNPSLSCLLFFARLYTYQPASCHLLLSCHCVTTCQRKRK